MSTRRTASLPRLTRDPEGRPLCRWCRQPVTPPRRAWCSQACVDEYLVRSNPAHARSMVLARDHGICALCGLDTLARAHDRAHAGHTWEMDHVVPVCEGGGECGLDGLRTLCIACHRRVTAELAARRARRNRPQQEIDL